MKSLREVELNAKFTAIGDVKQIDDLFDAVETLSFLDEIKDELDADRIIQRFRENLQENENFREVLTEAAEEEIVRELQTEIEEIDSRPIDIQEKIEALESTCRALVESINKLSPSKDVKEEVVAPEIDFTKFEKHFNDLVKRWDNTGYRVSQHAP